MKASDLFVQALEAEGVEYIFGVPGEENLDFLESLRQSSIRLILTRHEQAAGFMAATYGRLTGRTGVSLATLGPGALNLVNAAAYAQLGAMPMLMITGQKPIKAEGNSARIPYRSARLEPGRAGSNSRRPSSGTRASSTRWPSWPIRAWSSACATTR